MRFHTNTLPQSTIKRMLVNMFPTTDMDTEDRKISNYYTRVTLCTSSFNEKYTGKAASSHSHHRTNAQHTYQRESFNTLNDKVCTFLDSKPQLTPNKESASRTQNQNKSSELTEEGTRGCHGYLNLAFDTSRSYQPSTFPNCKFTRNIFYVLTFDFRKTCVLCIFLEQLLCMPLLHLFSIKMVVNKFQFVSE